MGESSRKGKISLSGLTKGSTGASFPSFRFSPENEEIEEIMLQDPTADDKPQSLPESPKPSGSNGDVSPLKEMLKHKWANKWEKRSLSLDLDLKGKIITAIEDKRKSIFSQFIAEETGIIPPSVSIAEHIGYAGDPDSLTAIGHHHNGKYSHSHDCLQNCVDNHAEVEEVGMDYLAAEDNHLENVLKFSVPPEELQEYFAGYYPLYHRHPKHHSELPNADKVVEIRVEELKPISILSQILTDVSSHKWTKYFISLVAVAFFLPSVLATLAWVLVGGMAVIIFQESLLTPKPESSPAAKTSSSSSSSENLLFQTSCDNSASNLLTAPTAPFPSVDSTLSQQSSLLEKKIHRYASRTQGWMTEFEGDYDPFTCHVRLTKIVFVRLEGHILSVSYPHSKHRIPKRPLWNDPPILNDLSFVRHCIYNISDAAVSIAPDGLARNRAWNKKYPIAIRFPSNSVVATVSPGNPIDPVDDDSSKNNVDLERKDVKKELSRDDCSLKTIWLFSRTDREKDDWFRRLQAASKTGPNFVETSDTKSSFVSEQEGLHNYLEYMRKVIPSLSDESLEKTGGSLGGSKETKESGGSSGDKDPGSKKDASDNSSSSSKLDDTPSSSRKGSPALDDSMGLEILTVPHSPVFLNAFLGRLFFDFFRSPDWTGKISGLIQKKLNYIRRPQFLETLLVRDLDLGSAMPIIQRASSPSLDSQGLWLDLDLTYEGNLVLTLETKINLLKLRKSPSQEDEHPSQIPGTMNTSVSYNGSSSGLASVNMNTESSSGGGGTPKNTGRAGRGNGGGSQNPNHNSSGVTGDVSISKSSSTLTINGSNSSTPVQAVHHMFDSDADDSGESSEDDTNPDDFIAHQGGDANTKEDAQTSSDSKGKKILKMAEKIASSKYVQHATEMKMVKKAIANVANTPIVLSVELKSLAGTLVLNIPPPPADRLWMGFRHNPTMQISARPKFGSRAVNLTQVTDWIKKKLLLEFQRVIVFPNMNDVTIPLMEFKIPK